MIYIVNQKHNYVFLILTGTNCLKCLDVDEMIHGGLLLIKSCVHTLSWNELLNKSHKRYWKQTYFWIEYGEVTEEYLSNLIYDPYLLYLYLILAHSPRYVSMKHIQHKKVSHEK